MDNVERDFCEMECGEEELDESQKTFYSSRLKDVEDLFRMFADTGANSRVNMIENAGPLVISSNTPVPSTADVPVVQPAPRPLIVLDPARLNQLVTSSNSIVSPPVNKNSTTGHNLPPLAPSVRTVASTGAPTCSKEFRFLTLSNLLADSMPHPARQGPRMRFPVHPSQTAPIPPTQTRPVPPMMKVRPPVVTLPQVPPSLPVQYTPNRVSTAPRHGIVLIPGPRCIPPVAPRCIGSPTLGPQLIPPPTQNPCINLLENNAVRPNYVQSTPLPPDLPLLPETRPETANDTRPRPRPGPASRTQRLPSSPLPPEIRISSDMVDLTQDDPDVSQEAFKKGPTKEKTFPSLIVTARASLKIFSTALVNNERLLMDNQIRRVMQMTPSVFTEYLLSQSLLKTEQFCSEHRKPLKLGVHSSPNRYPTSGGYVWVADCCKSGICSVYKGSIFDKTLQPPSNIMKLMYHWACNTAVHNVVSWVKVDSYVLKTYNTFFRAVCTSVVHQKFNMLGGPSQKIQVGVISIGTCPDGGTKEVKVDIMAVMDPDIPSVRLKVLENFLSDSNKVYESKFRKILEVLKEWVHRDSIIVTDFAVDTALCLEYGFANLVVSGGRHASNNNNGIMDYMRAKIPAMFQNTLGLLSYTIIQQFLDELVWRETWGPFPSRAFDSLVEHLAEMMKLPGPDLISKLKKIAADPSKDWRYSVWQDAPESADDKTYEAPPAEVHFRLPSQHEKKQEPAERGICVDPAVDVPWVTLPQNQKDGGRKVYLEPYYYGNIDGDPSCQKRSGSFLAECALCKRDFLTASSFTNHLIHHALNKSVGIRLLPDQLLNVCSYCCKPVRDIDHHMKEKHGTPLSKQSTTCKICQADFKEEEKIVKHMTMVHQELDMPYKCDLCFNQTSVFDNALHHFKDFHDKDYCVRCPYCFKVVRVCTSNGVEIKKNQYYFVQHIQKHSVSKLNRKCEKCLLSFTNMSTLKLHQERMHKRSGRLLTNVKRLKFDVPKMVVMSLPTVAPLPPVTLHESNFHMMKGKALSSSVVVPEYYAVCSCLECDGPMTQNHFSVKMTCTRCSFQSCCANSIREHSARHHSVGDSSPVPRLRTQIIGGDPTVNKPLHCSYCMFSSKNGNKMADHLWSCGDGCGTATSEKRKGVLFISPRNTKKSM